MVNIVRSVRREVCGVEGGLCAVDMIRLAAAKFFVMPSEVVENVLGGSGNQS